MWGWPSMTTARRPVVPLASSVTHRSWLRGSRTVPLVMPPSCVVPTVRGQGRKSSGPGDWGPTPLPWQRAPGRRSGRGGADAHVRGGRGPRGCRPGGARPGGDRCRHVRMGFVPRPRWRSGAHAARGARLPGRAPAVGTRGRLAHRREGPRGRPPRAQGRPGGARQVHAPEAAACPQAQRRRAMKTIVVGTDGSAGSARALRWANELAAVVGADVAAVPVCGPPSVLDAADRAGADLVVVAAHPWAVADY